ncbi:hypothetical protein JHK82_026287 [Glycine max]|uniref:Uncharacterized protein n=1 Tax=Glycine max TaxID=3847 RepID=K7LGA6_SOYBN|nr:hypothetical protein JHK87_026231 [Glycine soja]KAG5008362.1 hypothetical protein JHK85_026904 [Glycine max]KAG5135099.1 hypothetical protein JHK82_026287 [Glycine max]KAH1044981.1 hypothetical protein GYH30_026287 [Glycine max]KRH40564.1 hypothetical protein GLYMA_09G266800v4 [Glycine max]
MGNIPSGNYSERFPLDDSSVAVLLKTNSLKGSDEEVMETLECRVLLIWKDNQRTRIDQNQLQQQARTRVGPSQSLITHQAMKKRTFIFR